MCAWRESGTLVIVDTSFFCFTLSDDYCNDDYDDEYDEDDYDDVDVEDATECCDYYYFGFCYLCVNGVYNDCFAYTGIVAYYDYECVTDDEELA